MTPTIPITEAARVADRVVHWCTEVKSGEQVLLLCDERSDINLISALWSAAESADANVMKVELPYSEATPHGYLTWSEPSTRLVHLMAESDVVVGYTSTLFCLTQAVAEACDLGTRFMWLPGSYDFRRPLISHEDWKGMGHFGEIVCQKLAGARHLEVESRSGTRLTAELTAERQPFWDDVRATQPGEMDFFPGGMWNTVPITRSVNGRAVFEGHLHPVGLLMQPIEVEYEDGRLVSIKGGRQALEWERWLRSFSDEGVFDFSHLSGGLAKHARVFGHDWEDLIIRGSILLSGGENVLYGGDNLSRAHFDGVVLNATLHVDSECILKDGEYQV